MNSNPIWTAPTPVRIALILFALAWFMSAQLSVMNTVLSGGDFSATSRATFLPLLGLAIQGTLIYMVARGSNVARIVLTAVIAIASFSIFAILGIITRLSVVSATLTVVGYFMRVVGTVLLFTSSASPWFKKNAIRAE
jgi:hypothetical protein